MNKKQKINETEITSMKQINKDNEKKLMETRNERDVTSIGR